ncbi:MAG: methylated-DNA--[protein]-cysteine S-methyltransferase [Acidimicrobiales bacterium]|nr:MAG: methylated-DNA--[protein]-cysteine S-methyltransferase [Acidimicrobiales bacterium]
MEDIPTADKKQVSENIAHYTYMDSPIGLLLLAGCKNALRMVSFPKGSQIKKPHPDWIADAELFGAAKRELDEYFAGTRTHFTVPMILDGTDFQKQVWQALIDVEYGHLATYGDIAKSLGKPGAARAVGGANNANPIPIIVPCHRIIGSDQSLTGFGGGLPTKQYLLDHEAKYAVIEGRLI